MHLKTSDNFHASGAPRVGGNLWLLLAGFLAAALLTLGAAIGTSFLHQQNRAQESVEVPVAQL